MASLSASRTATSFVPASLAYVRIRDDTLPAIAGAKLDLRQGRRVDVRGLRAEESMCEVGRRSLKEAIAA